MYIRIKKDGEDREIRILHGTKKDWESAMALAWRTFARFDAGDCSREGCENFLDYISDPRLKALFEMGRFRLYVAKDGEEIVGVLGLRNNSHISLLFVDAAYHGCGVGRALVSCALDYLKGNGDERYLPENEEEKVMDVLYTRSDTRVCTVQAALPAVEFYRRMGFSEQGEKKADNGIVFQPMSIFYGEDQ